MDNGRVFRAGLRLTFLAALSLNSALGQPTSPPTIPPAGANDAANPWAGQAVGEASTLRAQPNYPTPYAPASVAEIEQVMQRVHAYLEGVSNLKVLNRETNSEVTDLAQLPPQLSFRFDAFRIISYEWGVTYSGMLLASEITGDARYRDYTAKRLDLIARLAAHLKAHPPHTPSSQGTASAPNAPSAADAATGRRGFVFRSVLEPRSLDDAGAMCAAMIRAHRENVGGDLRPWIDNYMAHISQRQMRLADGTLARNRPLPNSLWLDDLYMSVPALSQMGKLTGDRAYFDDAAKQILQFADRMFVREKGLYMHGWVQGMDTHPHFHWGRANGWAIVAKAELLDLLPEDHPARPKILALFREHARGLAACQGHAGLWHQLLDRTDSYEETSATAMYVFALARGINRGWLDPLAYGPMVSLGWNAVAKKINDQGQVEGTCVGTGMGWEPMFYMYRPISVYAAHGYGPVFMAGAEMIALRKGKGAEATVHDGGVHFGKATSLW
jgi:unsaturated rhamnogalacturonyl hydrolase